MQILALKILIIGAILFFVLNGVFILGAGEAGKDVLLHCWSLLHIRLQDPVRRRQVDWLRPHLRHHGLCQEVRAQIQASIWFSGFQWSFIAPPHKWRNLSCSFEHWHYHWVVPVMKPNRTVHWLSHVRSQERHCQSSIFHNLNMFFPGCWGKVSLRLRPGVAASRGRRRRTGLRR